MSEVLIIFSRQHNMIIDEHPVFLLPAARIVLSLIALLFVGGYVYGANYSFTGSVVDRKGHPISGVTVFIEKKAFSNEIDLLIFSAITDEKGEFSLVKDANPGDLMNLYLVPPSDEFGFNPFSPPFSRSLSTYYPQLFRKTVNVRKSRNVNLGVLRPDFPFTHVQVSLGKKSLPQNRDLFEIWLVLVDPKGVHVEEANFGELRNRQAFNSSFEVDLVLPKGKWVLKTCGDTKCKSVFGSSHTEIIGRQSLKILVR